jgi:hypothetical protein
VKARLIGVLLLVAPACGAQRVHPAPPIVATEDDDDADDAVTSSTIAEDEAAIRYKDKTILDFDDDTASTSSHAAPADVLLVKRRPSFRPMVRRPAVWTQTSTP